LISAAAAAAASAVVTSALPHEALGATGDPIVAGQATSSADLTSLTTSAYNGAAFTATSTGGGVSVGISGVGNQVGVEGNSDGTGVHGGTTSGAAVAGDAGNGFAFVGTNLSPTVPAITGFATGGSVGVQGIVGADHFYGPPNTGVYGGAGVVDAGFTGVIGESPNGTGVRGKSNTGIGVRADSGGPSAVLGQSLGNMTGVEGFSGGGADTPPAGVADTGVLGVAKSGRGVHAFSGTGTPPAAPNAPIGAYGEASGADPTGVWGEGGTKTSGSTTGVYGEGDTGVWGFGGWGVFGASDASGTGVYGFSGTNVPAAPAHAGVFGYSDSGTGVYARAATGTALYVNGKANFSRSGKVAVTAGHSSVAKTLAGVTTSSLIIAVIQTYKAGYYLAAAVPAAGKFTIYLNKAATSTMYVAYFVVN
jgi:hypothetical protein